jgi:hypothetical protein
VVYQPDLRHDENERYARVSTARTRRIRTALGLLTEFAPRRIVSSEHEAAYFLHGHCALEAMRWADQLDERIPPEDGSIEQIGCQHFWAQYLLDSDSPNCPHPPTGAEFWRCALFGPPSTVAVNPIPRLFTMHATDAAQLILPRTSAEVRFLPSHWLIHLADRAEPLHPNARRQYLSWVHSRGRLTSPRWVTVNPNDHSARWWAVRLRNVFYLWRIVVEQAIDAATRTRANFTSPTMRKVTTVEEATPETPADEAALLASLDSLPLSAAELAVLLECPERAKDVSTFLSSYKNGHRDCFIEVANPSPAESHYRYVRSLVWPALQRWWARQQRKAQNRARPK